MGTDRPSIQRRPRVWALRFPKHQRRRELAIVGAIVSWVVFFLCYQYRFFDAQTLAEPLDYWGDALLSAAVVKACEQGAYLPFVSKMVWTHGAPAVASWNDWPIPEELLFIGIGWFARLVGLFRAITLTHFGTAAFSGVSLYLVLRSLRVRWVWGLFFGAIFGMAPFVLQRTIHHLNLVVFWHVPWALLLCVWLASRAGAPARSPRYWFGVGISAVTGLLNPYFLYFLLQLLVLSTVSGWLRHGLKARKAALVTWIAVGMGCFLLSNLHTIVYQAQNGPNPQAVARSAQDLERFAMKPFEIVFPQTPHRVPFIDQLAGNYSQGTMVHSERMYIGLVGALAWLATLGVVVVSAARRRPTITADLGLLSLWLSGLTVIGGLNAVLGAVGFILFRSTNRVSIFLMALGLMGAGLLLTRATRRWPTWLALGLVVVLTPLATLEQTFPRKTKEETDAIHVRARGDQELVALMQSRVPKDARIFQLPAVDFPEAGYDPFRPALWADGLRFSFGAIRGRPEAQWQHRVASLPPAEMLAELDRNEFKAIYILGNGQQLANAFSAIRPVEFFANPAAGASVIILGR